MTTKPEGFANGFAVSILGSPIWEIIKVLIWKAIGMTRLIGSLLVFVCFCGNALAQGWTPFIPPPAVPEQGVPFLKDDPAYPKYQEIYAEMQANYATSEEVTRAGRAIEKLQRDFPKSPYPFFALAEYKYMIGMMSGGNANGNAEVNAILDRVMRGGGAKLPDGYILLAKMHADMNDRAGALQLANVAVKFAPNKPESQFALARAEEINNHYAQAEQAYLKFLQLESNSSRRSNIYWWLGDLYTNPYRSRLDRDSNREKAREAFRKSAELDPTYRHQLAYAKYLLTGAGDAEAAASILQRMSQQDPSDGTVQFYSGLVEYLRWAKENPAGGSLTKLDAIQKSSGMTKEDAFGISARYDGMGIVTYAMLRSKAIKNVDIACSKMCEELEMGMPAIVNAAFSDNFPLLKELVGHGANVNAQGFERRTPLIYAMFSTDVDLIDYLLKKGARVNVSADDGLTPMAVAIMPSPKSGKLVSLLLKHKADPMTLDGSQPIVFTVASKGNLAALGVLLAEGKINVNIKNKYGLNLLFYSLSNPDAIRFLLSKGADPWQQVGEDDLLTYARNSWQPGPGMAVSISLLEEARKKASKK